MNAISAAKIQVLALTPIKHKLGPKWDRLSALVHKLFQTALRKAQRPGDRFIQLDELSYVVTFAGMTLEETTLLCNLVAKEVCQTLFGDEVEAVAVRCLVAQVQLPAAAEDGRAARLMDSLLELKGLETVVRRTAGDPGIAPTVTMAGQRVEPPLPPLDQIKLSHDKLAQCGRRLALFPVWELRRGECTSLFLAPCMSAEDSGRRALAALEESRIAEFEISNLKTAAAYVQRISSAGQVCAVGTGVGFDTLSRLHSRIRYLTTLQGIYAPQSVPLLVRVEQIPPGVPLARLAELTAMLKSHGVRVSLEFEVLKALPEFDILVGASGLGGAIPAGASPAAAAAIVSRLVRRAASQKAFTFLNRLDTPEQALAARNGNVRFGIGKGLGRQSFTGLEPVPHFPLAGTPARKSGERLPMTPPRSAP